MSAPETSLEIAAMCLREAWRKLETAYNDGTAIESMVIVTTMHQVIEACEEIETLIEAKKEDERKGAKT